MFIIACVSCFLFFFRNCVTNSVLATHVILLLFFHRKSIPTSHNFHFQHFAMTHQLHRHDHHQWNDEIQQVIQLCTSNTQATLLHRKPDKQTHLYLHVIVIQSPKSIVLSPPLSWPPSPSKALSTMNSTTSLVGYLQSIGWELLITLK